MKLSEEMAVRLHRMMWSDMQKELGDNPSGEDRLKFKKEWIEKNFPDEHIPSDCWLCGYSSSVMHPGDPDSYCKHCPMRWPNHHCNTIGFSYAKEPISDILALPAKNEELNVLINPIDDDIFGVLAYSRARNHIAQELADVSGRDVSDPIKMHIRRIQEKAVAEYCEDQAANDAKFSLMYSNAKTELAKASGLPEGDAVADHIAEIRKKEDRTTMGVLENFSGLKGNGLWIIDHVKKIQEKAVEEKAEGVIYDFLYRCEKYPDIPINERLKKRLCAIQEKAVEDYFKTTPGAKLATMDVDQAFKQYADEQKAPIFHALAEASGLSAGNDSVKAHISEIRSKAKGEGRKEAFEAAFGTLSDFSGVSADVWAIGTHVDAIIKKASKEKDMEILRKTSIQLADKLNDYKDALSKQSGLPKDNPVDNHIREIVKNSMEAGAAEERDRIQEKVYEVLLS